MNDEQPKSVGLGDTVAKAIQTISFGTVKPCSACKKRQEALNKMLPYKEGEQTPPKPCTTCAAKKTPPQP